MNVCISCPTVTCKAVHLGVGCWAVLASLQPLRGHVFPCPASLSFFHFVQLPPDFPMEMSFKLVHNHNRLCFGPGDVVHPYHVWFRTGEIAVCYRVANFSSSWDIGIVGRGRGRLVTPWLGREEVWNSCIGAPAALLVPARSIPSAMPQGAFMGLTPVSPRSRLWAIQWKPLIII